MAVVAVAVVVAESGVAEVFGTDKDAEDGDFEAGETWAREAEAAVPRVLDDASDIAWSNEAVATTSFE